MYFLLAALTLTVPLPDGCTPQLQGTTIVCSGTVTPPPVVTPPPTPPGVCTLPQLGMAMTPGNSTYTQGWSGGNVLIVSFTAPASGNASLQLSNGGPPYVSRVATLSTSPCGAPLSNYTGQTPRVNMRVGGPPSPYASWVVLTPGVRYFWTVYNRNQDGSNSCPGACNMRVDLSAFN